MTKLARAGTFLGIYGVSKCDFVYFDVRGQLCVTGLVGSSYLCLNERANERPHIMPVVPRKET